MQQSDIHQLAHFVLLMIGHKAHPFFTLHGTRIKFTQLVSAPGNPALLFPPTTTQLPVKLDDNTKAKKNPQWSDKKHVMCENSLRLQTGFKSSLKHLASKLHAEICGHPTSLYWFSLSHSTVVATRLLGWTKLFHSLSSYFSCLLFFKKLVKLFSKCKSK